MNSKPKTYLKDSISFIKKYGLLILAFAWPLLIYMALYFHYGEASPYKWHKKDFMLFMLMGMGILPLILFKYVFEWLNIDFENVLFKQFNFKEYDNKTITEVLLSHYTNVASIGLLIAILIYSIRPYANQWDIAVVSSLVAFLTVFLFFIYGTLFAKTSFALKRFNIIGSLIIVGIMLFIDFQGISLFIESVPKENITSK